MATTSEYVIHWFVVVSVKIEEVLFLRRPTSTTIAGQIESTEAERAKIGEVSVDETSDAESQVSEVRVSWTWQDLEAAQRADPEIGPIVVWLAEKPEQPPWDVVTLKSSGMKTLWRMWSRLSIRDGYSKPSPTLTRPQASRAARR